jgi:hypothetical protein
LTAVRTTLDSLARQSKSVSLRSAIETGLASRPVIAPPSSVVPASQRRKIYAIAGSALVVIVVGAVMLRPRARPVVPTAPPVVSQAATVPAAPTPPAAAAVALPASAAPVTPATPMPKAADNGAARPDAKVTARDLALFRSMQTTALDARRRAADAGATVEQLAGGDDHNKRAATLAADGKTTEAVARLNLATTAWMNAERDARSAAASSLASVASNAAKARIVSEPPKADVVAPVTPVPIVTVPPAAAPPPVVRTPAANPSADIAAVVAAYARAIDSRDINEVKRAYPGATSAQASGFEQFFASVRSLHATFTVAGLDVQNAAAEGRVTGAYDYVTTAGKT